MGSTTQHHPRRTTGRTRRSARTVAISTTLFVATGLAVAACGGDDDAATSDDAATAATVLAQGAAGGDLLTESATGAEMDESAEAPADAAVPASPTGVDAPVLQIPGQAIAIEARATLQADDVRAAVREVTTAVTTRGGRVAAADIDYAPTDDGTDDDGTGPGGPVDTSRATLVLAVPPEQLSAVAEALDELGTVTSFDQFAEDVTDQLADLDTRIENMRASVERIRTLYTEAVDIDAVVRLEAELTQRETAMETLLATQAGLEDRVGMSTLTVDISATPVIVEVVEDDSDRGVVDALADGWGAFIGGLFAIVLVLAAIAPFVITAVVIGVVVLSVRHRVVRGRRPSDRQPSAGSPPPPPPVTTAAPEPETASRQG